MLISHLNPRFPLLAFACHALFGSLAHSVEVPIDQFTETAIGLECERISGTTKYKYFVLDIQQKSVFEWANEKWLVRSLNRVTSDEVEWTYWQVFSYVLNRKNLNLRQFGFANYRCVLREIVEIADRINVAYEGNKI